MANPDERFLAGRWPSGLLTNPVQVSTYAGAAHVYPTSRNLPPSDSPAAKIIFTLL